MRAGFLSSQIGLELNFHGNHFVPPRLLKSGWVPCMLAEIASCPCMLQSSALFLLSLQKSTLPHPPRRAARFGFQQHESSIWIDDSNTAPTVWNVFDESNDTALESRFVIPPPIQITHINRYLIQSLFTWLDKMTCFGSPVWTVWNGLKLLN